MNENPCEAVLFLINTRITPQGEKQYIYYRR